MRRATASPASTARATAVVLDTGDDRHTDDRSTSWGRASARFDHDHPRRRRRAGRNGPGERQVARPDDEQLPRLAGAVGRRRAGSPRPAATMTTNGCGRPASRQLAPARRGRVDRRGPRATSRVEGSTSTARCRRRERVRPTEPLGEALAGRRVRPSAAGPSPARSTSDGLALGVERASRAATTEVPLPPLTEQQIVSNKSSQHERPACGPGSCRSRAGGTVTAGTGEAVGVRRQRPHRGESIGGSGIGSIWSLSCSISRTWVTRSPCASGALVGRLFPGGVEAVPPPSQLAAHRVRRGELDRPCEFVVGPTVRRARASSSPRAAATRWKSGS